MDMHISYIYSKGYYDIFFFIDYFLGENGYIIEGEKKATPGYFSELREALDNDEDINLIVPRGHSKTTGIIIWILHSILYNTSSGIIYVAKGMLGRKGIGRIRGELETNKTIIQFFGDISPRNSDDVKDTKLKKWQQSFLEFTNGCWIATLSFGQSPRGQRPTKVVIDDPQDNKDVRNKDMVDKFNQWIFTSLYNTLLPGGSVCVVGTIVGELCLVKHLRDEKKWHTIQYEACDDNFGNILRPEMWSKESLMERRKTIGTANFNQEYRNQALQFTNAIVKGHWIRYYTLDGKGGEQLPEKFDKTVLAVDPAISTKESADYTGWCFTGHLGKKRYVIKAGQVKLSPLQNEEFIYSLYLRFNPTYVLKEDNVEAGITEHLKQRGVRIESIKAPKDKWTRLSDIAYMIEFGDVFFAPDIEEELLYQLTHFPDTEHDDMQDAFIYSVTGGKQRSVGIYSL